MSKIARIVEHQRAHDRKVVRQIVVDTREPPWWIYLATCIRYAALEERIKAFQQQAPT